MNGADVQHVLPFTDPVLIFALLMALILVAPAAARIARAPSIVGLLIAGMVVGPHGFNLLARDDTMILLETVGLIYLMFLAGVEIDLNRFMDQRDRSILFGVVTFSIPMALGIPVGLLLGYELAAAILIASLFASHTLLAYPIASRLGIAKDSATTTAVGGTIVTDTAALLVLAGVVGALEAGFEVMFWLQFLAWIVVFALVTAYIVPRVSRWFFRRVDRHGTTDYLFVLVVLFLLAFFAESVGIKHIVGAFFAGLVLNRYIPEKSTLMNRIEFVGNVFFIPFFLLSVGMLVDLSSLAAGVDAWVVAIAMTVTCIVGKFAAAMAARYRFQYSKSDGWLIFGLTVPQAAATLAVVLVAYGMNLFDDAVLNGAIVMIMITSLIGSWVVEHHGRKLAAARESGPYDEDDAPQRILVPLANPATAEHLVELAVILREPTSDEPIYPMTVVRERSAVEESVARAEGILAEAEEHAVAAEVEAVPVTRLHMNPATGIWRASQELRASHIVIGWNPKSSPADRIFGSILDQLLERTYQQVIVSTIDRPLNAVETLYVAIPQYADRGPGFRAAVHSVKSMAAQMDAELRLMPVGIPHDVIEKLEPRMAAIEPELSFTIERFSGWSDWVDEMAKRADDGNLVVMIGARRGTLPWRPRLERVPSQLAERIGRRFMVLYPPMEPEEAVDAVRRHRQRDVR